MHSEKKLLEEIDFLSKELDKKNKKLRNLDQLKYDFILTLSHELRVPLSIVKEGISLMLDGIPGEINEKQTEVLSSVADNINTLKRVMNDMLDVSRIDAGEVRLKRQFVNMNDLIKHLATSFSLKAQQKSLEIKTSLLEKEIDVYMDYDRIIRVFNNLIENSLKFTTSGSIEIGAHEIDGTIECFVTDTGIGINGEDITKVFSKFQQFPHPSNKRDEEGSGLGLSIAKGLVEMHKGTITCESEPGKGSRFSFRLPLYTTEDLFRQSVNEGLKESLKKEAKMTVMMVSVSRSAGAKQKLSEEELQTAVKDIAEAIDSGLRREGDIVARGTTEIIVILSGCGAESVPSVKVRLGEVIEECLEVEGLTEKIELKFGASTYPDDANSDMELIMKARERNG